MYNIDLENFIEKCFVYLNPGTEHIYNWHIKEIISILKLIENGEIKRQIINMPPRHMKSISISIGWVAWLLGKNPAAKIIVSSYSQNISNSLSIDTRNIINSDWYQNLFPNTCLTIKSQRKLMTTQNGMRLSVSINGPITGEGADYLIIDDPHLASHISSVKARVRAIDWFEKAFASRLNHKGKGAIIIVCQRLHEHDLCGYLLKYKAKYWNLLTIPAIATSDDQYRKIGDPIDARREDLDTLEIIKIDIGLANFNAQHQQNPVSSCGIIIKKEWIKYYEFTPQEFNKIIVSFDCAIKTSNIHDYSVGIKFGLYNGKIYVLDIIRGKFEFPELKNMILEYYNKWRPDIMLIEDKSAGEAIIQELKRDSIPVIGIKPYKNRQFRLESITPYFESSLILLPKYSVWLQDYENELLNFPHAEHDDQVDATSQMLQYHKARLSGNKRVYSSI